MVNTLVTTVLTASPLRRVKWRGKPVSRLSTDLPDYHVLERNVAPPVAGCSQLRGAGKGSEEVLWLSSGGETDVGAAGVTREAVTRRDILRLPFKLDRHGQNVLG